MRVLKLAVAFCAVISQTTGAAANDHPRNNNGALGWEAVGKLTVADRAMCTGALIAPDMVLTAAHCLFDPYNGRAVKPRKIQFEAGLTGGTAKATRAVVETVVHPDYRHNRGGANDASVDVAILKLSSPIDPNVIRPFSTDARPETGDELGVIPYTHMRRESPLWQHPCDVLARKGDVLVMNCEVDFGASGAPVFAVEGGARPRLVSVISSKAAMGNKPVAVGTIIDRALQVLLKRAR